MILERLAFLAANPGALKAILTWPKFSFTSWQMVSDLLSLGIRPMTVVDVGSNVGQFAVACDRLFSPRRIVCFEPLEDCAAKTRSALRNSLISEVRTVALGDAPGEQRFFVNRHRHSSSLLPMNAGHTAAFPHAVVEREIRVSVSTLDTELAAAHLEKPILLKLDVQGAEAQALSGGSEFLTNVEFIVVETSFEPLYDGEATFREILDVLERRGFRFAGAVGWLRSPVSGKVLQMDALFRRDPMRPHV